ncbi:MAG: hypothetical protein ABIN67_01725 [Ferruginibacter sp.]
MKKVILFIGTVFFMSALIAQETPREKSMETLTKEDYLKKARGQKTGAIVLISAGGALTAVGFILALNNLEYDIGGIFDQNYQPRDDNETVSTVLAITGIAAMLGSIPLFISAHKNKKHAMNISFKNEMAPQLQGNFVFNRSIPGISLKIQL